MSEEEFNNYAYIIRSNNSQEVINRWNDTFRYRTDIIVKTNLLHYAIHNEVNMEIIKFLTDKIPIDEGDSNGQTPLHIAALNGCTEIVKMLIKHDADRNIKNLNGFTALQLAEQYRHTECASIIRQMEHSELELYRKNIEISSPSSSIPPIKIYDVFLSYCHKDKEVVHQMYKELKDKFRIWIDVNEIKGGERLSKEIVSGIDNSKIFVAAISPGYEESNKTEEEFIYAQESIPVLPIVVENGYKPQKWLKFKMKDMLYIKFPQDGPEGFKSYLYDIEQSIENQMSKLNSR